MVFPRMEEGEISNLRKFNNSTHLPPIWISSVKFHSWGPKIRFHVVFHDGS